MKVGETTTAKAVITPENATNKTVTWRSSDESVVIVDKDGKITAKKAGKAEVMAVSKNGKVGKVEITVAEEKPQYVEAVSYTHLDVYKRQEQGCDGGSAK